MGSLFFFGYDFSLCDYHSIAIANIITSPNIIHHTVQSSLIRLNSHNINGIHNSTNTIAHTIVQNILLILQSKIGYFIISKSASPAIVVGNCQFHFSIHLSLTYSAPHCVWIAFACISIALA